MSINRRDFLWNAAAAGCGLISQGARAGQEKTPSAPYSTPGAGNWRLELDLTFGSNRPAATVRSRTELCERVLFYDQFGTANNGGGNYGADNMAPPECRDPGPCETYPASRPFHIVTDNTLVCRIMPKADAGSAVTPRSKGERQPVGASGFRLRTDGLPAGLASVLGRDMCWETRCRLTKPFPFFWWALWIAGAKWDEGAELDVPESFGFDNGSGFTNFDGRLLHSNSVGGADVETSTSWTRYVPQGFDNLLSWHTFTTFYDRDNSWRSYVDGKLINSGRLLWHVGGKADREALGAASFLIDNTWGHFGVASVRPRPVPASLFDGVAFEYDYTRIWLR